MPPLLLADRAWPISSLSRPQAARASPVNRTSDHWMIGRALAPPTALNGKFWIWLQHNAMKLLFLSMSSRFSSIQDKWSHAYLQIRIYSGRKPLQASDRQQKIRKIITFLHNNDSKHKVNKRMSSEEEDELIEMTKTQLRGLCTEDPHNFIDLGQMKMV